MLDEAFVRGWENFVARTEGPLNLRFVIQPLFASILAIRNGVADARAGRPPLLRGIIMKAGERWQLAGQALRDAGKVLFLAAMLDSVYQLYLQDGIYALELVFTASTLALFPYVVVRTFANYVTTWRITHGRGPKGSPGGAR